MDGINGRDSCGVVGVELEKFRLGKVELLRDHIARKLVDLGVHFAHAAIVIASRRLDLFFDLGEIVLQAQKILVGLKVGIGFGNGEDRFESSGQQIFSLRLLTGGAFVGERGDPLSTPE